MSMKLNTKTYKTETNLICPKVQKLNNKQKVSDENVWREKNYKKKTF